MTGPDGRANRRIHLDDVCVRLTPEPVARCHGCGQWTHTARTACTACATPTRRTA